MWYLTICEWGASERHCVPLRAAGDDLTIWIWMEFMNVISEFVWVADWMAVT